MKRRCILTPALLLLSCEPRYDGLFLDSDSAEAQVRSDFIEVPLGSVVVAEAAVRSKNHKDFSDTDLELRSDDPAVLGISRADRLGQWTFVGVSVGQTCVEVIVDHEPQDCIAAEVAPQ